jgi:sulfatase maturation enzyme AslB (radical SAM superfamily)
MLNNFSVDNWKHGISGIGIEISSDCNMRCKYCYYYRDGRHISTEDFVTDDKFYVNTPIILDKCFKEFENLSSIEFWGAEPLLHINRIKYVVDYVIDNTKKSEFRFLVSSNMNHSKNIITDFFEMLDSLEEKLQNKAAVVNFAIQTSIDFPKELHNKQRVEIDNKPTFNKVKSNYLKIAKKLGKKNYQHIVIDFFTKGTLNIQNIDIKKLDIIPEEINSEVIDDLAVLAKVSGKCRNFGFNIDYYPTPATGIKYTLDEGLKNYVLHKSIYENFENLYLSGKMTYANALFFIPNSLRYLIAELLNLDFGEENFENNPVCRAGIHFVGVRGNGDIYSCHHFFSVENRNKFKIGNVLDNEYNDDMLQTILNTFFILKDISETFEKDIFMPKYTKNLNYGSLGNISNAFYKFIIRNFCFGENCELDENWSALDLDSWLKLYSVEWVELTIKFIIKFKKIFEAIDSKRYNVIYGL